MRPDGRRLNELRRIKITRNYIKHAEGSVLIEVGDTRVICAATVEDGVPAFLRDKGQGWVTAEYAMLPRSARSRTPRESSRGKVGGRTHEIQRLIGRSLRSIVDLTLLGSRTIWLDCDVIQADGGTRTASISGAYVALVDAVRRLLREGQVERDPLTDALAAVSVGIVEGKRVLDLCYAEDSAAEVDMNVVMTGGGGFVEVQGTAEGAPFSDRDLSGLLTLARRGIREILAIQKDVLSSRRR